MVDGAVVHMRLLRVVVEDTGEVILIRRHRVQVAVVVVGLGLVTLQGETAISAVRGSLRGVLPLGGIRHRIGVGGVIEEGDGRLRIHDPEARRDGELHDTIDITVWYENID